MNGRQDHYFRHPRSVTISAAAMRHARTFAKSVGGSERGGRVVAFNWADQVSERDSLHDTERQLGACLMIGAYQRDQVPADAVAVSDGVALTIHVPDHAWPSPTRRLIDVDDAKPFGLTLR